MKIKSEDEKKISIKQLSEKAELFLMYEWFETYGCRGDYQIIKALLNELRRRRSWDGDEVAEAECEIAKYFELRTGEIIQNSVN